MKYTFDDIVIADGLLKITITTDASGSDVAVHGDYFLNLAETIESVEENGAGGVLRISDVNIEVFDRDGIFQNEILSGVTIADFLMVLNVAGTDYALFPGSIDLSTVEYPSYYDSETGTEYHSCKFIAFSIIKKLESVSMTTFLADMDTHSTHGIVSPSYSPNGETVTVFKIAEILKVIQSYISFDSGTVEPVFDFTSEQTFWCRNNIVGSPISGGDRIRTIGELYLLRSWLEPHDGLTYYSVLWSTGGETRSFMPMKNVKDFLMQLCSQFLAYPVLVYDPAMDVYHFELKQRENGSVVDSGDVGTLLTSNKRAFYGYGAIQSSSTDTDEPTLYFPDTINAEQFGLTLQTYTHVSYLSLQQHMDAFFPECDMWITDPLNAGKFLPVQQANFSDLYSGFFYYNQLLLTMFSVYWTNRTMYERSYSGVAVGGSTPLKILDRVTINSADYSVIEIKRDLIKSEVSIKAVLY